MPVAGYSVDNDEPFISHPGSVRRALAVWAKGGWLTDKIILLSLNAIQNNELLIPGLGGIGEAPVIRTERIEERKTCDNLSIFFVFIAVDDHKLTVAQFSDVSYLAAVMAEDGERANVIISGAFPAIDDDKIFTACLDDITNPLAVRAEDGRRPDTGELLVFFAIHHHQHHGAHFGRIAETPAVRAGGGE